jgi:hypothetical protein
MTYTAVALTPEQHELHNLMEYLEEENAVANQIVTTITNDDDGISALVFHSLLVPGTYGVTLRDDDADMTIGRSVHGLTQQDAEAKGREWAGLATTRGPVWASIG